MNRKQRRVESARFRKLEELEIRYGARTVFAAVVINTDEVFEDVAERLWKAAQNEREDMVAVTSRELEILVEFTTEMLRLDSEKLRDGPDVKIEVKGEK